MSQFPPRLRPGADVSAVRRPVFCPSASSPEPGGRARNIESTRCALFARCALRRARGATGAEFQSEGQALISYLTSIRSFVFAGFGRVELESLQTFVKGMRAL